MTAIVVDVIELNRRNKNRKSFKDPSSRAFHCLLGPFPFSGDDMMHNVPINVTTDRIEIITKRNGHIRLQNFRPCEIFGVCLIRPMIIRQVRKRKQKRSLGVTGQVSLSATLGKSQAAVFAYTLIRMGSESRMVLSDHFQTYQTNFSWIHYELVMSQMSLHRLWTP